MASLADGGTPARFVIIDDGWQSVQPDHIFKKKVDHISGMPPPPKKGAAAALPPPAVGGGGGGGGTSSGDGARGGGKEARLLSTRCFIRSTGRLKLRYARASVLHTVAEIDACGEI